VKKGEKGIMIFAPMLVKQRNPSEVVDQNKKNDVFRLTGFRTAYVFDVEQTEGRPLPQFAETTGDPKDFMEKLKNLVAKEGISLEYDKTIAPALGMSSGGRIRLVPGLTPAEEFSVLAHELAHEMLHHRKDTPSLPKQVRETQAEAVAYVVSRGIGLETNTAAADYIGLYNGDKKTLAESLSVIQETSARILDNLLPEQRRSLTEQRTEDIREAKTQPHDSPNRSDTPNPEPPIPPDSTPDRIDSISLDR
jgi:hypothetical protein